MTLDTANMDADHIQKTKVTKDFVLEFWVVKWFEFKHVFVFVRETVFLNRIITGKFWFVRNNLKFLE